MSVTESKTINDVVLKEWDTRYCREVVTVSGTVVLGEILQLDSGSTSSTEVYQSVQEASAACAVALEGGTDTTVLAIIRGPVIFKKSGLVGDESTITNEIEALRQLGMLTYVDV